MPPSTPVAPLDGAAVRRETRRATAARARTTLSERLSDAWGGIVSAGIGVAVVGGSLASLREAGTAVLFASHDADMVGTVADEVLVVDDNACRLLDPVEAAGRIAEL